METFTVVLPDGTEVDGIPVGTTKEQIRAKLEPRGFKFDVQKSAMDKYADEDAAQVAANKEAGALSRFGKGVKAQAGRFALGGLELANNLTGDRLIDPEVLATAQQGADVIDKGTGAAGFAGNVVGDPLTWALGGVGGAGIKAAKTTGQAVKAGAKAGALVGGVSGLTQSTGDAESNVGTNLANAAIGAGVGAGIGGIIPGAVDSVRGLKNTVAPKVANEETARLAKVALDEGIPLAGSQVGGSRFAKSIASVTKGIPFSGGKEFSEKQIEAFNRAALKKAGVDASAATPNVLSGAKDGFKNKFSQLTKSTQISVNDDLLNQLAAVEAEASRRLGKDATNTISSYIDDVLASGGKISGEVYQNTRSDLGRLAKSTKDTLLSNAYRSMQKALDDAAFASLDDAGKAAWQETRKQYGAFKTIQDAMNASGEQAAVGNISPARLAIAAKSGNPDYAMGAGELNELSRVGSAFLKDAIPNSGSPERLAAYGTIFGAPGALAGGVSGAVLAPVAGVGASRAFNAIDTAQPLVRRAIEKGVQGYSASSAGRATPILANESMKQVGAEQRNALKIPSRTEQGKPPVQVQMEPMSFQSTGGDYFQKLAQAESGGNPNAKAKTSSASGLYQFTDGTWAMSVAKWGKELGIDMKDKNNPEAQHAMVQKLTEDNARILSNKLGRQPDEGEMYVAHVFGANGAAKLIDSMGKGKRGIDIMPPKVVKANQPIFFKGKQPRTAEEVYALLTKKVS